MSIYLAAFLIGAIAGLRSMTAPAAVSWAARLGWLSLGNSWLSFMGASIAPYIFSVLAIGELIADKLPATPSRKAIVPFAGRLLSGALCGAAVGSTADAMPAGLVAGVLGSIAGTLGGYQLRVNLAKMAGKDLPIALLEDVIAIAGAFAIVASVR